MRRTVVLALSAAAMLAVAAGAATGAPVGSSSYCEKDKCINRTYCQDAGIAQTGCDLYNSSSGQSCETYECAPS